MVGKYQKENNLKVPEKLTVINVMGRVYKFLATCTQDFKCMKFGFRSTEIFSFMISRDQKEKKLKGLRNWPWSMVWAEFSGAWLFKPFVSMLKASILMVFSTPFDPSSISASSKEKIDFCWELESQQNPLLFSCCKQEDGMILGWCEIWVPAHVCGEY